MLIPHTDVTVPPPLTTGCTVNGTNTGTCCQLVATNISNGFTSCTTSPSGVDQLRSCLNTLLKPKGPNQVVSNFNNNNTQQFTSSTLGIKPTLFALTLSLATAVLVNA